MIKNELAEMRFELDMLTVSMDMKADKILDVSRKMDKLILEFYRGIGIYAKKSVVIHKEE